ncbi:hypothetical protein [Microbacterium enclense]|uniref:hypothetical protein n=1 Tax=Microbacterium enclense TaxID=993073 RepID=UPI003F7F95CD
MGEFRDEIHKHIPKYKQALNVLQRIGLETFPPDEFVTQAESGESLSANVSEQLLRSLFEFSLVGLRRLGGPSAGSGWSWKYQDSEALFGMDVKQVKVHPGLKEALKLKEARDKQVPVDR